MCYALDMKSDPESCTLLLAHARDCMRDGTSIVVFKGEDYVEDEEAGAAPKKEGFGDRGLGGQGAGEQGVWEDTLKLKIINDDNLADEESELQTNVGTTAEDVSISVENEKIDEERMIDSNREEDGSEGREVVKAEEHGTQQVPEESEYSQKEVPKHEKKKKRRKDEEKTDSQKEQDQARKNRNDRKRKSHKREKKRQKEVLEIKMCNENRDEEEEEIDEMQATDQVAEDDNEEA